MRPFKLLLLCFAFVPLTAISQTKSPPKSPDKGKFMFELNFNPFGEKQVFSFDHLQTKYWLNGNYVLRLGLELNLKKDQTKENGYREEEVDKPIFTQKSTLFGFRPGFEYHILKNTKVSPYVGFELNYRNNSSSRESTSYSFNWDKELTSTTQKKYDGTWMEVTQVYVESIFGSASYLYNRESMTNRAFHSLGANLIFGSDFYFVKNMYFGFEAGLGYQSIFYKRVDLTTTTIDAKTGKEEVTTTTYAPASSSRSLDFYYNSSIRLGVWF